MQRVISAGFIVLVLFVAFIPSHAVAQVALQNAFPNLAFNGPVGLYSPPDSTGRLFVVEQGGTIDVFPNNPSVTSAKTFLDVTDSIVSGGELGLLGLTFHPDFKNNRTFFVYYTVNNSVSGYPYASIVAKFTVSPANPDSAVRSSQVVLMRINQPFPNHKGGQLVFGPDGYLYIGLGDGGSGGDPFGNGQNKTVWLGKILRINVDSAEAGLQYAIPADNPFVHDTITGIKKEIFAYGLRNPWRFSFDPVTDLLWAGDVGQDLWEEVDTIHNGGNYGWNIMEGLHCYNPPSGCDTTGLIMPLHNYQHVNSQCSITGGFVYRGSGIPTLYGFYVYADYCAGRIWAFDTRQPASQTNSVLFNTGNAISSFGVDSHRELYFCGYADGKIYKFSTLTPAAPSLHTPANGQTGLSLNPLLTWTPVPNASAFHLQVATDSLFQSVVISDSTAGDTTKLVGPLAYSTKYYWHVNAANGGGTSAYSSTWNFRTLDPAPPPPGPALLTPPNLSVNQPSILRLSWQHVPTALSYHCQVALDSGFASTVVDDTTLVDTFRQVGPLINDTVYYWMVRCRNDAGYWTFSSFFSFRTSASSVIFQLNRGWNMIAVPMVTGDYSTHALYSNAVSNAFAYVPDTGYVASDTLRTGVGYWIRYPDTENVSITGLPLSVDSVAVASGWNMIGSVGGPVAVNAVQSVPPGLVTSQFFGYGNNYSTIDSIRPGKGYWVKVSQAGELFLDATGGSSKMFGVNAARMGPIRVAPISELPPPAPDGKNMAQNVPSAFMCSMAYPNPFNPTTVITYQLPAASRVTVKVFNVLGQVVEILKDNDESPGVKQVGWNASSFASGLYFYRLDAVSSGERKKLFTFTGKMLLLR